MKQIQKLFLAGIICCGLSALPLFASATSQSVYISEVAWAGSSVSPSDEFIELYNPTNETMSLAGWSLSGAATNGGDLSLPEGAAIQPNSTYLISNYDSQDENSALAIESNFATSALSLPNSKLSVALLDANGVQVDTVGDGTGTPPFGGSGSAETGARYRSMTRVAPDLLGSLDDAWADTNTSYGLEAFVNDFGTPGVHLTNYQPVSAENESAQTGTATTSEQESNLIADTIQVNPSLSGAQRGVITVIYQGYTFELNLPNEIQTSAFTEENVEFETEIAEDVQPVNELATTEELVGLSSPQVEVAETDEVENVVEPPTEEMTELIEGTFEVATETTEATSATTLRFSELYPNTIGNDEEEEYIEVENYGPEAIDLLGWSIVDASGKTWTADGSYVVNPGEVAALSRILTKITLNNTSETVTLKTPTGEIVDSVSYSDTTEGSTYTRTQNGWNWSDPTPNTVVEETIESTENVDALTESETTNVEPLVLPNIVMEQASNENSNTETTQETPASAVAEEVVEVVLTQETQNLSESSVDASSDTPGVPTYPLMTITEARTKPVDTRVSVEGYVSVLPGTFATQFFYIENGDGVQIYMYKADFPTMAVGNLVHVQGVISQNHGEVRIKTSNTTDIVVIDAATSLTASYVPLESIGEAYEGKLVMVDGNVESVRSTDLTLTKDAATLEIVARSKTGVSFSNIASGDQVQITGIVSEYDGSYRVLPRFQNDIVVVESHENTTIAGTTGTHNSSAGLYGAILMAGALGAVGIWFVRSRRNQDLTLTKV